MRIDAQDIEVHGPFKKPREVFGGNRLGKILKWRSGVLMGPPSFGARCHQLPEGASVQIEALGDLLQCPIDFGIYLQRGGVCELG